MVLDQPLRWSVWFWRCHYHTCNYIGVIVAGHAAMRKGKLGVRVSSPAEEAQVTTDLDEPWLPHEGADEGYTLFTKDRRVVVVGRYDDRLHRAR